LYAVIGPAAYADVAGGRRVTELVIGAGADVVLARVTAPVSGCCRRWTPSRRLPGARLVHR